ncbi:MAG: F0F1 ATP synthase subunit B [Bacillota bacterium]|nr:F0F1 ATP synthase subunit B [Bacillota bacterium]
MVPNLIVASDLRFGLIEFNWTFVLTLANAIILFLIVRFRLFKPIQKFMADRENEVKQQFDEAERAERKAQELRDQYEQQMSRVEAEGSELLKSYAKRAELKADEIVRKAKEEADFIKQKTERELETEVQKTVHQLKNQLSELTVLAASRVVDKELKPEDHSALIDRLITEVGDTQWQN